MNRTPLPFTTLQIQDLRLSARLGCSPEERHSAQPVRFEISLRFPNPPVGCTTDRLNETVCYADLCQQVKTVCEKQEFILLEKLGFDVFQVLKEQLKGAALLAVRVTKENPPIAGLAGGASFRCGDWETT